MKKLLLTLIVTLVFCGSIFAQHETYWTDFNDALYEDQEAFVCAIMIDGVMVTAEYEGWDALEIGAFVKIGGEEVCRGINGWLTNEYVEEWGDPYPIVDGMAVNFTDPNDVYYLKMYDHNNGIMYTDYTLMYEGDIQFATNNGYVEFTPDVLFYTGHPYDQGWDDPDHPLILCFTTPTYELPVAGYGAENTESTLGYYLITSPLKEEVAPEDVENMVSEAYDLYAFDQNAADGLEWRNYKSGDLDVLVAGQGYLYASQEDVVLKFKGGAYDGDGKVDLVYEGDADMAGWNLVGNPYLDAATVDVPMYYRMNELHTDLILVEDGSAVASMEGIFVLAEAAGEVNFTVEEPVGGKGGSATLNLSNGRGVIDRAVVRFGEEGQMPKFQINGNSTKVYIEKDNRDYAAVSSEGQGEMPVSFKAEKNGTYTLTLGTDVEFGYLHLIDNMTGNDVDLLATPSYSFEATTSDYASRFRLVFATGEASDGHFAFISDGQIILNGVNGNSTVNVFDVTGRQVSSARGANRISTESMSSGVYMIQLVNGENVMTQKIVVK